MAIGMNSGTMTNGGSVQGAPPGRSLKGRPLLGVYYGFQSGRVSEYKGPIIIYVGSLWEYCKANNEIFEKQVEVYLYA